MFIAINNLYITIFPGGGWSGGWSGDWSGGWSGGGGSGQCCRDGRRLTEDKIEEIKEAIGTIVFDDRIAHAVRISFHDCVGKG